MNRRDRMLALGVLTVAVLAGAAFLFHKMFLTPLADLDASLVNLQQEVQQKEERVRKIEEAKVRLARWKQLSLPGDIDFSRREYEIYLNDLLRESGFNAGYSITPKSPEKSSLVLVGKGPAYTRLPFQIVARASLANLVEMLDRFYQTGLLHQIRSLGVQRLATTGPQAQQAQQAQQAELDIHMTVEALIVAGADNRPLLLPAVDKRLLTLDVVAALRQAPTGLGLVLWAAGPTGPLGPRVLAQPPRHYAAIAKKNIFLGSSALDRPEVIEVAHFVQLTDITHNDLRCEAFFRDRYNNRTTRLRAETGFDRFQILDTDGEILVRGKVIRLDGRELIFEVDQDGEPHYYSMHVGQTLDLVLKHPLSSAQLKDLGLTAVAEKISTGGKSSDD